MNNSSLQKYIQIALSLVLVAFGFDILMTGELRSIRLEDERYIVGSMVVASGCYVLFLSLKNFKRK